MTVYDIATVSQNQMECKYYQIYWQIYQELHPSEIAQLKANWWQLYTEFDPSVTAQSSEDWKTILANEEQVQQAIVQLSSVSFDWTTIPANEEQFQQMMVQLSSEFGTAMPAEQSIPCSESECPQPCELEYAEVEFKPTNEFPVSAVVSDESAGTLSGAEGAESEELEESDGSRDAALKSEELYDIETNWAEPTAEVCDTATRQSRDFTPTRDPLFSTTDEQLPDALGIYESLWRLVPGGAGAPVSSPMKAPCNVTWNCLTEVSLSS